MTALGVAFLAYMIGCFSTGYYLVRLRTGEDLRAVGSGATGGRNAARVLGPLGLILTGAGDIAKSFVAVGLPLWFGLGPLAVAAAMVGLMAGHIWPVQLRFRGGKGVAPLVASTALAAPIALIAGAFLAVVLGLVVRRQNLGGLVGFTVAPAVAFAVGTPLPIVIGIVVVVVMAAVAHRSNIREDLKSIPPFRRAIWGRTVWGRTIWGTPHGGGSDG